MRMVIRGVVAVLILIAAYWGWALAGAAQLASAASRGDPEAVMERIDLQPLIRSLSSQIARAYLDQNPQLQNPPSPRQGVFLNAAAAEMLLRALLTPENIAALLNRGRVGVRNAGGQDAGTVWGMPSLGEAFNARPLEVLTHSYFNGPLSFVVGLDSPDGLYRLQMRLSGLTWRLSAVDIPKPVTARLANLIAKRIGGAVSLPGG
jgi:Protein of unknown function (DUF2939)